MTVCSLRMESQWALVAYYEWIFYPVDIFLSDACLEILLAFHSSDHQHLHIRNFNFSFITQFPPLCGKVLSKSKACSCKLYEILYTALTYGAYVWCVECCSLLHCLHSKQQFQNEVWSTIYFFSDKIVLCKQLKKSVSLKTLET